ncbi:MAG TPA: prephenate dehydrogenase/arogenate dehydrogenase family protein [Ignavibacteriaceae bacterium]|nr:prephenate dehydrogenase/arogenate dehydrogenase family protein [Ignavibacteriaceae bacterium]
MKNISIIGLGLIGGSLAKAVKNYSPSYSISGFDTKEISLLALKEKTIDKILNSEEEACNSDLIFLCLPTELSLTVFSKILPLLKKDSVLTDVCGVKGIFEDKWKSIGSEGFYIGGHPMAGKEVSGYENSDPLLFENAVYILSDKKAECENYDLLLEIIKGIGSRIKFLNPYLHDEIVAGVSHLPQLVSIALVNSVGSENSDVNFLDFAAGGFRDMTRIASSDFGIWEPVIKNNKKSILQAITKFNLSLIEIIDYLIKDDLASLKKLFESARLKRDEIPKNTKGFLNPLFDLYVYVKDEPGVLSRLTTVLYENSINIKDIELLKIREGAGGTFRISFDTQQTAEKAKGLIEKSGFTTRQ